jgi:polysaccharide deacetylase family protein (PEP-CTERM system associated)
MSEIIFTMDVEDPDQNRDGSFVPPMLAVLDWLASEGRVGTFFVVGELAEKYPEVVKRIHAGGHEVGLHGWQHRDIKLLGEKRFRRQTERGKELLEDISGAEVSGYRAPMFSLTAETPWADATLKDLGFTYSSSVLPANNPRFAYPGQPRQLYTWPSGLIELPAPIFGAGLEMPILGGIYFRYFPNWMVRFARSRLGSEQVPWFYCHPYDFYWDKAFVRMRDTPLWVNLLLMGRRRFAMEKMREFFQQYESNRTLLEYVRAYGASDTTSQHASYTA